MSTEWVTNPEQVKSSDRIVTISLWTGVFWANIYIYIYIYKVKVKQSRYTPWRRLGKRRYSSYSFSTSELDRGE
jgi:hypothetical protein